MEKENSSDYSKQIMSKNILYYMNKYNQTRNDVCEALGVKYTTFTDWIKGNSYPRIDKIELMADYFGISKADLIEEHPLFEISENDYNKDAVNTNEPNSKEIIAENIRYYMSLAHISQTELCNTLDIKMPTFSDWIHAKTYPRIDKIELMASYFGVSKADLIEKHSYNYAMDDLELKIKSLIISKYGNMSKFCKRINMSQTALDNILKRGILNSSIANVIQIANELNLNTEELINGKIVYNLPKCEDPNILNLYKNIKSRRLELKMSQDSLAELTGYKDRSSITKIEKGEVDLAESKIRQFAKALNLSPQELMGWKEKENSQMSSVKERIFGAVTIMSEKDAEKIWELIQANFALGNAEEVPAEPEEIEALDAYQNGNPEYQPRYTHEEMLRELGLEK